MKQVNLRELYPDAYEDDEYVDVSDEVYGALREFERKEEALDRRKYRHRAQYTLNAGDGIEHETAVPPLTPEELFLWKETRDELFSMVMALPEKQSRRIYERFYNNVGVADIAGRDDVSTSNIYLSLHRGLHTLREKLKTLYEQA